MQAIQGQLFETGYGVQDLADPLAERFDRVIEWLLAGLLAFMPLAFGVVHAWSEEVLLLLVAAIAVCFALKALLVPDTRIYGSWAYIPIGLFILVAAVQLVPLPVGLMEVISGQTVQVRYELLADLPGGEPMRFMPISLYPQATRHGLRLLLAIAAVFFIVHNMARSDEQIRRLLTAIAAIGGGVALIALVQGFLGNGKIYGFVPTYSKEAYSGPFINHSHYGQFMNLSMGAALALLLVHLQKVFTDRRVTPASASEYLASRTARSLWLLLGVIVLGAATVFVSLTRGGMVAMLIAGAFTAVMIVCCRGLKARGWIIALAALLVFMCLLYMGFDAVYDRLGSLHEFDKAQGGRTQILKDIASAWTRFPLLGTGLGTHEVVYPMFDRAMTPSLAGHAENEYAQTAEETGGLGLLLLIVLAIMVAAAYVRNLGRRKDAMRSAAYGLGFGLLAILLHSLSDFGQHLPANAMLSAIFVAVLLVLARRHHDPIEALRDLPTRPPSRPLRALALVCVLGVSVWAVAGADRARAAESLWNRALAAEKHLADKGWSGGDAEYIDLISHAAAAAETQGRDVHYRYWLNVYRWRSVSRTTDPNTGELLIPAAAVPIIERIAGELLDACRLCPTYGPSYCVAGQLMHFVLGQPLGEKLIARGFALAPSDPTACYVAGMLDIEQNRIEDSFTKLQKAVQLSGGMFREIATVYANHLERADLALALAGDEPGRLSQIVGLIQDRDAEVAQKVRERVFALLEQRATDENAPASVFASLAGVYAGRGDSTRAIECYRRALTLDYDKNTWRIAMARLLAADGQVEEAIRQARICLRLDPQMREAVRLIEELSVGKQASGNRQ